VNVHSRVSVHELLQTLPELYGWCRMVPDGPGWDHEKILGSRTRDSRLKTQDSRLKTLRYQITLSRAGMREAWHPMDRECATPQWPPLEPYLYSTVRCGAVQYSTVLVWLWLLSTLLGFEDKHCAVRYCTVLLYYCIIVLLYYCIIVFLYSCILVFLYSCILVFLYSCILVFLYSCILVFSYSLQLLIRDSLGICLTTSSV
jgi:hypothetical protein